ncbi:hypothetical protein BJX76DRAFT_359385 [Aspergillus varians]
MQHSQPPSYKTACRTCRDRKVKCNKVLPCRNCSIAGIACSYPPQVRTVRRPKKAQNRVSTRQHDALTERIDKLEALLKKRSPVLNLDDACDDLDMEESMDQGEELQEVMISPGASMPMPMAHMMASVESVSSGHSSDTTPAPVATTTYTEPAWESSPRIPTSYSRRNENDRRESEASYWRTIEEECASQVFLKEPSTKSQGSDQEQPRMPGPDVTQPWPTDMSFPFNSPTAPMVLPMLTMAQRQVCWREYLENVDPLLKILHRPTTQALILIRDNRCYTLDPPSRALIQAVCLLAITSMSEVDISTTFENDKESVTRHCALLTEQALMAAKFLEAQDLITVQALLLFVYYLRCTEDPRLHALNGMAVFLAIRAGLNRDGAASGLPYLEVELRRRTWWQLITLVDHPDESGIEYLPPGMGADSTRLPLNVNDSELDMQSSSAGPNEEERTGFTETSFCLMQYEIIRTFNQIKLESARISSGRPTKFTAEAAEQRLQSSREYFQHRYFQESHKLKEVAIGEFAADVIAMVLAKRRLLTHISLDRNSNSRGVLPPDAQDRLFLLAVKVLELSRSLQTKKGNEKWRWLSATYFQWSITAFVVRNLTIRPSSTATNRAWHVVDGLLNHWPASVCNSAKAHKLKGLIADAMRHRDAKNLWSLNIPSYSNIGSLASSSNAAYGKGAMPNGRKGGMPFKWTDPVHGVRDPPGALPLPFNQAMISGGLDVTNFGFDEELADDVEFGLLSQLGQ